LKRMWHPCTWYYFFPLKFNGFNHVLVDSPKNKDKTLRRKEISTSIDLLWYQIITILL
jgi:hypothetical protein